MFKGNHSCLPLARDPAYPKIKRALVQSHLVWSMPKEEQRGMTRGATLVRG